MHITEKGQVTIPIAIREHYGFLPHTEVEFEARGDEVVLKKAVRRKNSASKKLSRGEAFVKQLRGSATIKMSTEEIMRLTRGDDWGK